MNVITNVEKIEKLEIPCAADSNFLNGSTAYAQMFYARIIYDKPKM